MVAVALLAGSAWVRAGSPAIVPDAFYTPPTDFRTYPGLDHLSLVAADSPLTPTLVAWDQARLAGNPARTTC